MRTTAVPSIPRPAPFRLPWVVKFALCGAVAAAAVYRTQQKRRMNFAGASVLISGGSRGLGLELARVFADEGANLVLLARDEDALTRTTEELRMRGTRVLAQVCDIRDPHQVRRSLATIFDQVGSIDVLVNNAGTIQVGPLEN